MKTIFALLLVLMIVIHEGHSLTCQQCSTEENGCDPNKTKNCRPKETRCIKATGASAKDGGVTTKRVYKDCYDPSEDKGSLKIGGGGCNQMWGPNYGLIVSGSVYCVCEGERCNSGNLIQGNGAFLGLTIAGGLVVFQRLL